MIRSYRATKTWYDITGYGHEGRLEGLTRKELADLSEEIDDFLLNEPVDVSEEMQQFDELIRAFKCPSGLNHNVNCDCQGRRKK